MLTIKSKFFGRPIRFFRSNSGYVWVDASHGLTRPGTLGDQLTRTDGNTITCREENFEKTCRNWLRARG